MRTLRVMIPVSALLAAALPGCSSDEKRPPTLVETTAGTTTTSREMQNELAAVQRERNDAQMMLAQERSARERELQEREAHDALELRMVEALGKAGTDMQALKDKAATASAKDRKTIEMSMEAAKQHKTKLLSDMKRLHSGLGETSFDAFRSDVQATIRELERTLAR